MKNLKFLCYFSLLLTASFLSSCGGDDPVEPSTDEPKARFTPTQDATDPFTYSFVNESINATTYAWDFGDGETSTEESPSHKFAAAGTYTVMLTATGTGGTNSSSQDVSVVDPNIELKKLTGETSKTWKLLRDLSNDMYPLQVGPSSRSEIWWAYGLADPINSRPCLMEEEYIFSLDGTFEYKTDGTVFADFGVWADPVGACIDETDATLMVNNDGVDLSPWGSGTFTFDFDPSEGTLTLNGIGAHVGLPKIGTDNEYLTPQPTVTYKVTQLTDDNIDMMILETDLTSAEGYWQIILVSYDDPADEPALGNPDAIAGFGSEVNGNAVTFTNTSTNADSYMWDFGDGATSTEESPTYTYSGQGIYVVSLTATNAQGSSTSTTSVILSDNSAFSADVVNGGTVRAWKLAPIANALAVGSCKGCGNFFATSLEDVMTRSCTFDDEYGFDNLGNFGYATNGDVWGEGYMGVDPAGCVAESSLSTDAAAWGTNGAHTYTVTESTGTDPAYLTVKGTGAFIGLPKAFNGGEYAAGPPVADGSITYEVLHYVNDGTNEFLVLTIDISEGETGGAYWNFILQVQ